MSRHTSNRPVAHCLGLWSPNRYGIDLSNEVINIDFGQEAAKISVVKVGGRKKYLPAYLVPHLKDLFHINKETKAQGF